MNYREYISDYLSRHSDIHPVPVDISALYRDQIQTEWNGYGNEEFRRNANLLPSTLSREDVISCFRESNYKGFVAAMLWGGMSLNHIKAAMSYSKEQIEEILKKITKVLNTEHDIRRAYLAFSEKLKIDDTDCKIPGVGESYFTKLLFFLNGHDNTCNPLIYDNQLKRVHAALMKDDGLVDKYFTIRYRTTKNGREFVVSQKLGGNNPSEWQNVDFYMDYLVRMKSLAENYKKTPGELEGILFGSKIRSRSYAGREREKKENPRAFVRNYLEPQGVVQSSKIEAVPDNGTEVIEAVFNEFLKSISETYPHLSVSIGKTIYNGIKTQMATDLPSGWTLAIGKKSTFYFCGIYRKEITDNPYPEVFDKEVKKGYYKKFKSAQEALNQFEDILRKESQPQNA